MITAARFEPRFTSPVARRPSLCSGGPRSGLGSSSSPRTPVTLTVAAVIVRGDRVKSSLDRDVGGAGYVRLPFLAHSSELAALRRDVRSWLRPVGLSPTTCEDLLIAVNEAASNVVEHAYDRDEIGALTVELWCADGAVHIAVSDHGQWSRGAAATYRDDCLGLRMMRGLVDSVVIHTGAAGTQVVLQEPLPARDSRQQAS